MHPWERFGIEREEYARCMQAAEELRGLWPEAPAPTVEELAREWGAAKASQLRLASWALWKALGLDPTPLVRRFEPTQDGPGRPTRG